jgi:hypothetical protein
MQYKVTNKEKHTEVEIDNDFEGYILNTYVSDKTIEKVGKDKVEAVISDLIEYGAIDTDEIEDDDGYDEYMRERYCNEISDLEDEEVENRKAWEETLASLPR